MVSSLLVALAVRWWNSVAQQSSLTHHSCHPRHTHTHIYKYSTYLWVTTSVLGIDENQRVIILNWFLELILPVRFIFSTRYLVSNQVFYLWSNMCLEPR